jgi:acetyltransferase-like isoleucine patch superfamily enzyme
MKLQERARWKVRNARKQLSPERMQGDLKARWYLRHAEHVGARPFVQGWPLITTPHISVGDDFVLWSIHRRTHLGGEGAGKLIVGDGVTINSGAIILAFEEVSIGDHAGVATEVFISDSFNHPLPDRPMKQGPVVIGEGAWIATRAMLMAGVKIGARAIVAAGAVVTGDVPAETLVAGVPARVVRPIEYPPGKVSAWKNL